MMRAEEFLDAQQWAETTFGACQLRDRRRTKRVVKIARRMAENPSASLPAQMQTWKDVIALYRLLDEADVTFEALMRPHFEQTRERIEARPVVLLVQDTTELDFTLHPKTTGLGPIGDHRGRGMLLQTVLAIDPTTQELLGCAHQEPLIRRAAPVGETRVQRRRRSKETDVWSRCVQTLGSSRCASQFVHVGDRGADLFEFLDTCHRTQTSFVVRAAQDLRVSTALQECSSLFAVVLSLPPQDQRPFDVPASHNRKGRLTTLAVSWTALSLLPPRHDPRLNKLPSLAIWVVRVWEPQPPEGEEPLEWILLTSSEVKTSEQAWQRVEWYRARWTVEEYHQSLKTGCRIEARQVQSAERLIRLLGLLAPVAVRLLQLRDVALREPDRLATEVVEADLLAVVAAQAQRSPALMTTADFWREVARQGGYLARCRDGPPGWKTLWRGWLRVQTLLEGVHLATHLRL
jgi:hypothetical protein